MDEMIEIRLQNEAIARKFLTIETNISSARNVKELYETFLLQTEEEFQIPYIWFSFVDNQETDALLRQLESSEFLKDRLNRIDASLFLSLINNKTSPVLANDDLKPYYKLLPKSNKYFIKSLAIAPITLNGEIIGSLNYGDSLHLRYSPDMDTTVLHWLAEKFSSLLSNILINEENESLAGTN